MQVENRFFRIAGQLQELRKGFDSQVDTLARLVHVHVSEHEHPRLHQPSNTDLSPCPVSIAWHVDRRINAVRYLVCEAVITRLLCLNYSEIGRKYRHITLTKPVRVIVLHVRTVDNRV